MDSVLKDDGNYYTQKFLKECKYKDKKIIRQVYDHLSAFSSSDECHEE